MGNYYSYVARYKYPGPPYQFLTCLLSTQKEPQRPFKGPVIPVKEASYKCQGTVGFRNRPMGQVQRSLHRARRPYGLLSTRLRGAMEAGDVLAPHIYIYTYMLYIYILLCIGTDLDVDIDVDIDVDVDADIDIGVDEDIDVNIDVDVDKDMDMDLDVAADIGIDVDVDAGIDIDIVIDVNVYIYMYM